MGKKLKILHLEDSSSDAHLIYRVLKKGNFEFERLLVETEEAYIGALDKFVPDLILSDHSLPSFNSHEALKIFLDRKLKIPFILITSNVSEEFAVDVIKKGADDYILKDRLERLPSAIQNALEKYRLEVEKQGHLFELIKNGRHFRALIENGADVLVVLTEEGKPKYVSPSILKVLGYTEEEALQLNLYEVLHPDDLEPAASKLAECIGKPGVPIHGYEGRIKNKKGEWVWLEATLTNMLHDPTIKGIINNFRNITERKLANSRLVKSQLFNKTLLSSLDAHIAVINKSGTIIAVNKAWEDFATKNGASSTLRTSEGSNYFEACEKAAANGDQIADQTLKGIKAVLLKNIEIFKIEYPCHSTTEKRWFVMSATSFDGDDAHIVVSHQNITDRKLAEEKALLNELMFRRLIENSSDGMAIISPDGKPKYVSPSLKNVLGYTEKEGMGLDLMSVTHPEDVPLLLGLMQKAVANPGMPLKCGATRVRHKDQSWHWVEGVLTNMLHDPAINGIVDNFRDVTERVIAEQAIIDSELKYRSFFENSMDGILLTVTNGDIFAANPAACTIFQMTEEEICQRGRFGLVDNDDLQLTITTQERQRTGATKIEITLVRKDGSKFPGEITSAVFKDNSGLERTSMIIRDISERKVAEAKILDANRLYGFISQINQTIVHVKDAQILFNEACRIAVEFGKFKMAWIGTPQPEGRISLVASHGATPAQIEFFSNYSYEPGGAIDQVLKSQNQTVVENTRGEGETLLNEVAGEGGFNSVIVLPIKNAETIVAIFSIYSTEFDFFDEQETALLTEATMDVSFAITVFEKEDLRLLAQRQLLDSDEKLRKALSIAKLGYWELNLNDKTLYWSEETFRIWGREKDVFIPTLDSLIETIHPNDRGLFISEQAVSSAGTKKLDIEYRIILPDNSIKWVNDKGQIVTNDYGEIKRFEGTVQDITERKAAEEQLIKTEFQYKQIVETAQEGIWLIDDHDKTTFINDKLCQILGYTKVEMLGKKIFDFQDDDSKAITSKALAERRTGISDQRELKLLSKSGKAVWANITASPFFNLEGQYNGSLAMVSDITEAKALQQLLDEASKLARMGTFDMDLMQNQLYWSPMTKEIHEVPSDFVPDITTAIDFYNVGLSRDAISKAVANAVENGTSFDLEVQIVTAKGNLRWVRAIGEAECIDGKCMRLYGSFQDVDKIKNSELEVLKAYEEKNDILESIGDAFFAVDRNWIVTYWNNKAETVLKRQRQDILHKNLWDVYFDVVGTPIYTHYHEALKENKPHHFEAYYNALNIWFEISAYPSSNGLSVFFKDISERKTSETKLYELNENLRKYADELLMSNKGLEQFSYVISHNLRAPVANILGLMDILKDDDNDLDTNKVVMSGLVTNVDRLNEVVLDLNNILNVKSHINELKETFFLTEIIENIKVSIQSLIDTANVKIDLSGIVVDELYSLKSYLHSIFYNLITNSIKYRHPQKNPIIEIKSWEQDGKLLITYVDNGRGIDVIKNKDNIFGLYKRFHTDIEGKGVGLYMIKTQVETLGGNVSLQSEVNNGVQFTFEFLLSKKDSIGRKAGDSGAIDHPVPK